MATKNSGKSVKIVKTQYGTIKVPQNVKKTTKKGSNSTEDGASEGNKDEGNGTGLKEVFRILSDENGRVTSAKLRNFVKELELDFTDEEISEMIQVVDPDGKGEVTYDGLVGIVRDFKTEFPSVELTPEEMKRELSTLTTVTEESTQKNTSVEDILVDKGESENNEHKTEDTQDKDPEPVPVTRPAFSRNRGSLTVLKEKSEDKMSVIKEDDELQSIAEEPGEDKKEKNEENKNDKDIIVCCENETKPQDIENKDLVNEQETEEDVHTEQELEKEQTEEAPEMDETSNDDSESGKVFEAKSEKSFVQEHRLDSAVSTAVSRLAAEESKESEKGRQSRRSRRSSEPSLKSRRNSTKSETCKTSKSPSRQTKDTKQKPKPEQKVVPPQRRKLKEGDPEFYSAIGCSLKLSQIRMRQRLLFVMWRAVYDEAVKRAEKELREKAQKRRKTRLSLAAK